MHLEQKERPQICDIDYVIGHAKMRTIIEKCIVNASVDPDYDCYPKVRIADELPIEGETKQYTDDDLKEIIKYVGQKQQHQVWIKERKRDATDLRCNCCVCDRATKKELQMWEKRMKKEIEFIM